MKFKVGDKVRAIKCIAYAKVGALGTVIGAYMRDNVQHFCVEFDENIGGHDGNGIKGARGKKGHCWWFVKNDAFEKINNQKIVITSDGKETLARLYDGKKVIKTATAQCSPDDTFDFKTGAMLAFERLMNDGKKPLTFREKLKQEHPEKLKVTYGGGCKGCPKDYGYINEKCPMQDKKVKNCRECWDREITEQKTEKKKEKPFKFEVGKQYIGSNTNGSLVIEITRRERDLRALNAIDRYEYKVVKGRDDGMLRFDEACAFANRLKPYDPPKYFNGKAVCIEVGNKFYAYTKGKVYEFKDGKTENDNGYIVHDDTVTSINEWNNRWGGRAKMLEIVE